MNKRQLVYLEKARTYALSKDGQCLSEHYDTIKKPLQWKCKDGHEWERNYEKTIHRGIWCTVCFHAERERLARESIQEPEVPSETSPTPSTTPTPSTSPTSLRSSDSFLSPFHFAYYPFDVIREQYKIRNIIL